MMCAELEKLKEELDHMHTECERVTKENENLTLKLEENGNHDNIIFVNNLFIT